LPPPYPIFMLNGRARASRFPQDITCSVREMPKSVCGDSNSAIRSSRRA
jgi:hypothetical protein